MVSVFYPSRNIRFFARLVTAALALTPAALRAADPPAKPGPDTLVLVNGDTLHGKFVSSIQGKVTFHSDVLGDLTLSWDKVKTLETHETFGVVNKGQKFHGRKREGVVSTGRIEVAGSTLTLQPEGAGAAKTMPVANAAYVMDGAVLDRQLHHRPGLLAGWAGAATAGATLVTATQNQYTFSGGIALARVSPGVSWLDPRDRTSIGFTGSFGKITQPGYYATPGDPTSYVAAVTTKSAIYHAGAERDEYFSPRFYALAQVAFDHNYGQDLDLQQIYGGGLGWTVLKTPKQEADLKATAQYEKQQFISSSAGNGQNLVGSTFAANYVLHTKLLTYTQGVAYIPAYNNMHAYSTNETNTFAFPAYKNLSFSVGTLDSYLNGPPASVPPTKRNSFQFTMGLTYAIRGRE